MPSLPVVTLIGGNAPAKFQQYIERDDPCFGRYFSRTAEECKRCTCPVIADGQVLLLREVCQAVKGAGLRPAAPPPPPDPVPQVRSTSSARLSRPIRLTSREVAARLSEGKAPEEIFLEILNGCDFETYATISRQYLYESFWYIKTAFGAPVPSIPTKKELRSFHDRHQQGS